MKKLLLSSFIFSIALVGCGTSNIEKVETAATQGEEVAQEQAQEPVIETYGIGDTISVDGLHITLNSVRESQGSDWEKPQHGKYVIVDLSIQNNTDQPANISTMLQMELADDQGYTHGIGFFTDTKGSLDGEVGAGRTMRGEVAFDVSNSTYYEFIFQDPFKSGQAIWKFESQ